MGAFSKMLFPSRKAALSLVRQQGGFAHQNPGGSQPAIQLKQQLSTKKDAAVATTASIVGGTPRRTVATECTAGVQALTADYDPLRNGPLRYLGYTNELGESFRPLIPPAAVILSYVVAMAYVLVDVADKWQRAHAATLASAQAAAAPQQSAALPVSRPLDAARLLAGEKAIDTLLWQVLASVAIPGKAF